MSEAVKANDAEMTRLANRVLNRAKEVFEGVDFEAGAHAVVGSEFEKALREVEHSLTRAGGGATSRLENLSTMVKASATAITGQDAESARQVNKAGGVAV